MVCKSVLAWLTTLTCLGLAAGPLAPVALAKDCTPGADCRRQVFQSQLDAYPSAIATARQQKDITQEISIITAAAEAHQYFGRFQPALDLYQQALNLVPRSGNETITTDILEKMAIVQDKLRPNSGLEFLEQQLQTKTVGAQPILTQPILEVLGTHALVAGNYQAAIAAYTQYLTLAGQQVTPHRANVLLYLARAYREIGNVDAAIQLLKQRIALQPAAHGPELDAANDDLGELYIAQGKPQAAIAHYNQLIGPALQRQDALGAMQFIQGMALGYAALGDVPKTQQLLQAALDVADDLPNSIKSTMQRPLIDYLSISHAWSGDYKTAIALQQRLGKGFRAGGDRAFDEQTDDDIFYEHLGAFYLRTGNYPAAETALRKALVTYTESRQSDDPNYDNLLANADATAVANHDMSADLYRHLQETLVAQNKIGAALEMTEASRGRAFVGILSKHLGSTPVGNTAGAQRPVPPPNLAAIQQIAKAKNSTLVVYSPLYADLEGFMETGKLRLGSGPRKESRLLIWVVKPTGEVTFRSVDLSKSLSGKALSELVRDSRDELGVRGRGLAEPTAQLDPTFTARPERTASAPDPALTLLYQLLIAPIADQLPTNPDDRVTFLPQDALYLVPFAALQAPDGQYLIQSHTLLIAPSIQVLALGQAARTGGSERLAPALVVGDPQMPALRSTLNGPPERLASLPGAKQEALDIAQVLDTQALIGAQATKTNVLARMPQARVVHLATHGLLDNLQGLQSAIALGPDPHPSSQLQPNGFLTASQVLALQLTANLVVLSACDTGRGEITGDGVIGLSRSFLGAGAASVIVSLWAVPDAPTAKLMSTFYKTLKQNPDKAHALRQAMLTTLQEHPDPKDWAAFTLVGQP